MDAEQLTEELLKLRRTLLNHNRRLGYVRAPKETLRQLVEKLTSTGPILDMNYAEEREPMLYDIPAGRYLGFNFIWNDSARYPFELPYPLFKPSLIPRLV
jgi:hypothetical protein